MPRLSDYVDCERTVSGASTSAAAPPPQPAVYAATDPGVARAQKRASDLMARRYVLTLPRCGLESRSPLSPRTDGCVMRQAGLSRPPAAPRTGREPPGGRPGGSGEAQPIRSGSPPQLVRSEPCSGGQGRSIHLPASPWRWLAGWHLRPLLHRFGSSRVRLGLLGGRSDQAALLGVLGLSPERDWDSGQWSGYDPAAVHPVFDYPGHPLAEMDLVRVPRGRGREPLTPRDTAGPKGSL